MLTTTPSAKEKSRALELALQQIEKQFGKGAIMKLGDGETPAGIEVIPTGSIELDLALGVGGVQRWRIVEFYVLEWSGNTPLVLMIMANAQKSGGSAVFIVAEHVPDAAYSDMLI